MIQDFYDVIERDTQMRSAIRKPVVPKPPQQPVHTAQPKKVVLAEHEQSTPQPPKVMSPQKKLDLHARAEKTRAELIKQNTLKEPKRKTDAELTLAEKRLVEGTNRNMLKN